jgi:Rieske Fe-S protein
MTPRKHCPGPHPEAAGLARREILAGGLIAIGAIACGPGVGPTDVGALSGFAVGTWTLNGANGVIIGRDATGLFAYSAFCTHEGCEVDPPSANGIAVCQCHGSEFDGNGTVLAGPARSALEHYAVSVNNGRVIVDASKTVPATTRTPV